VVDAGGAPLEDRGDDDGARLAGDSSECLGGRSRDRFGEVEAGRVLALAEVWQAEELGEADDGGAAPRRFAHLRRRLGEVLGRLAATGPAPTARQGIEALGAWQRALHAAGFVGASWPKEYGGAGLSDMEQAILNEELARARAPGVLNAMAIWWVGPAVMRYGTDEQKRRFIPPILTADEIWATGYSEPTSGSDMAAA